MIIFDHVTVTYEGDEYPVLTDVDLTVPEGELTLVVGPTGSGKSTLLRSVNGLVPHFSGGTLNGEVRVAGRCTGDHPPRELADVVGYVAQDPQKGFITDVVEDELAYTMESLAVPAEVMRRRVEETLDLMGIADLRDRPLRSLSGGQRQRVAIGSVLTAHPRVLVLDEPTSALDPQAAEEVLATVQRLVHDLGLTVLMSEHRLERVVQYADRILLIDGTTVTDYPDPAAAMAASTLAPAVVELGRWAGWHPLPLSIRDARRAAGPLRTALAGLPAPSPQGRGRGEGHPVARLTDLTVRHGDVVALRSVSLDISGGEVVALMGRNGAGKSTLLGALAGQAGSGHVTVGGRDPAALRGAELVARVGLVPQEPQDLLWAETVAAECAAADRDAGAAPGTAADLFASLHSLVDPQTHPHDLSEGTRLSLVLAIMLTGDPDLLLLDEPTRGLDYTAKARLAAIVSERAARGTAVVIATHDVELVAEVADRLVMLADGEVVLDTDARSGAVSSPTFAPQVAKVVSPEPWLTVTEVAAALPGGIS
ncbi:MAG: ATP-binding cassette domain-containing protein [Candidatus Nanopelagicales bacterium]